MISSPPIHCKFPIDHAMVILAPSTASHLNRKKCSFAATDKHRSLRSAVERARAPRSRTATGAARRSPAAPMSGDEDARRDDAHAYDEFEVDDDVARDE